MPGQSAEQPSDSLDIDGDQRLSLRRRAVAQEALEPFGCSHEVGVEHDEPLLAATSRQIFHRSRASITPANGVA